MISTLWKSDDFCGTLLLLFPLSCSPLNSAEGRTVTLKDTYKSIRECAFAQFLHQAILAHDALVAQEAA